MGETATTAIILSRSLMGVFVISVTLWYFLSPYGARPSQKFHQDMEKVIESSLKGEDLEGRWIENWTKWALTMRDPLGEEIFIGAMERANIENKSLPLEGEFEWRSEYKAKVLEEGRSLKAETDHPWGSSLGIYHHYNIRVVKGRRVQFLPYFMFGAPQKLLDSLYGNADKIPTKGMFAESPGGDRILIQCFMNLVILTVILLLWLNNPPAEKEKDD